jgi:integrase
MSIELVRRGTYRVRWREGGRNRARIIGSKEDAKQFQAELVRRQRLGTLGLVDAGAQTLAEFCGEWWESKAPRLALSTQTRYAELLDVHVLPLLGGARLREIDGDRVERYAVELGRRASADTVARSLTLLGSILKRAEARGRIASNPVRAIEKPRQPKPRAADPLAPERVEALRAELAKPRDRMLVALLAYSGLRPGEALALRWRHVRERTLLVEGAVSLGRVEDTKTRRNRPVKLLAPLAADLGAYRKLAWGRTTDLIFPSTKGTPWSKELWANWRRRIYYPGLAAAGIERQRPYDLRHAFASLLISEGQSIVHVAAQLGHSPKVCLDVYAHVFEEFDPAARVAADERIAAARRPRLEVAVR